MAMSAGYPDPSYDERPDRKLHEACKRIRRWLATGFHLASRVELSADLDLLLSMVEANTALTKRLHRRTQTAEAGMHDTVADCRRQGLSLGRRLANAAAAAKSTECERLSAQLNEAHLSITGLRRWIDDLLSGMWVNCAFCGHRYIPRDASPEDSTALLRSHIAQCEKHPLHETREALLELYGWHHELLRFAQHMPDGGAALQESIERARRALGETEPDPAPIGALAASAATHELTTERNPS